MQHVSGFSEGMCLCALASLACVGGTRTSISIFVCRANMRMACARGQFNATLTNFILDEIPRHVILHVTVFVNFKTMPDHNQRNGVLVISLRRVSVGALL